MEERTIKSFIYRLLDRRKECERLVEKLFT